jgi:hypothetical protein
MNARAAVGSALLMLGLVCWGLSRFASAAEHHAFSTGSAPSTFAVTNGNTYALSVRGGVPELSRHGQQVSGARCEWSTAQSAPQLLQVSADVDSSKPTNVVATFTAPTTGRIAITCAGWGPVFVDDADGSSADVAGWLLVVAVISLIVGVGLALSALRSWSLSRADSSASAAI